MKRTAPSAPAGRPGSAALVGSVGRCCDILSAFRHPEETLELREIARRSRLNKSTVCRILATLVVKGFVQRSGSHGYRAHLLRPPLRAFRLGYAAESASDPFITTVTDSLATAAQAAGLELIVLNNCASRRKAIQNADRLIRARVDLAVEFQMFSDIAENLAGKFSAAGIPLIAIGTPHPGAAYFGADNYKAGHIAGEHLGRWAARFWHGEVDEILLLIASLGGPVLDARMLGVQDGIANSLPHTRNVPHARLDTKTGTLGSAIELTRRHLGSGRARRILIGTMNDWTALGALQAFRECAAERECAIVGQGAVAEARHEMRRPGTRLIGAVGYFPETYGKKIVSLALNTLNHRAVPHASFTKHVIVTPANVNQMYPNDLLLGTLVRS